MKRIKFAMGLLAILSMAIAVFFVLKSHSALLTHPKGVIAQKELHLMTTNILLMLIVIVPTLIVLFLVVWKYHSKNSKAKYDPGESRGVFRELILWIIPSVIVVVMAAITWNAAHELDPYKPLESEVKPLTIQVVALDWKWLFIYPEQGIATVNFIEFPARTPIVFKLTADGSPMNSFWLPQLSGQIYCMTGMVTTLHVMADKPGEYTGRAAEINGKGFADMTFVAKSTTESDFDDWVAYVKQSSLQLTDPTYSELAKPSIENSITLYSLVERHLFNQIITKYLNPKSLSTNSFHQDWEQSQSDKIWKTSFLEN